MSAQRRDEPGRPSHGWLPAGVPDPEAERIAEETITGPPPGTASPDEHRDRHGTGSRPPSPEPPNLPSTTEGSTGSTAGSRSQPGSTASEGSTSFIEDGTTASVVVGRGTACGDEYVSLRERIQHGLPDSLLDKALSGLEREEEFAAAFCRLASKKAGGPIVPRVPFRSLVPGREQLEAVVMLVDGRWRYCEDGHGTLLLAEAYAAFASGRWAERKPPELARWTRRMLALAGVVDLPPSGCEPLPDSAPGNLRVALKAIVLLDQVRQLVGDPDGFPLGRQFLSDWAGGRLSPLEAGVAVLDLAAARRIVPVGKYRGTTPTWGLVR